MSDTTKHIGTPYLDGILLRQYNGKEIERQTSEMAGKRVTGHMRRRHTKEKDNFID